MYVIAGRSESLVQKIKRENELEGRCLERRA